MLPITVSSLWIGYPHTAAYSLLLSTCPNPYKHTRREEFVNRDEGEMRTTSYHCHDQYGVSCMAYTNFGKETFNE
jgi:hypothetical protein